MTGHDRPCPGMCRVARVRGRRRSARVASCTAYIRTLASPRRQRRNFFAGSSRFAVLASRQKKSQVEQVEGGGAFLVEPEFSSRQGRAGHRAREPIEPRRAATATHAMAHCNSVRNGRDGNPRLDRTPINSSLAAWRCDYSPHSGRAARHSPGCPVPNFLEGAGPGAAGNFVVHYEHSKCTRYHYARRLAWSNRCPTVPASNSPVSRPGDTSRTMAISSQSSGRSHTPPAQRTRTTRNRSE